MIKRILAAAALVLALATPSLAQNYVPAGGGSGATTCAGITDAGTVCPKNVGTSGATVPLNSTANTFSAIQTVNLNAASAPTAITGTALQVFGADTVSGRVMAGSFGAIASVSVARADGTGASPTQVLSGEQIGGVNAYGYGSGSWQGPVVSFRSYAAENIDSTHYGSKACIATTPLASTTMADVFCVLNDGTLQINGNGIFGSTAAATFRHGGLDAASPVAQIIKFQDVVAGTSNTAGVNATIQAPAGTGTGAGGSLIFQVAPAGSTGTAKNAWTTALTIDSTSKASFAAGGAFGGSVSAGPSGSYSWSGRGILTSPASAVVAVGSQPNGAPATTTLSVGESSRSGTDTNVAGANGTITSGNGTGTGTPSQLLLQSPVAVASGTGAQTQTTGLKIVNGVAVRTNYAVASLPSCGATTQGGMAMATDSNATLTAGIGAVVASGGANIVPVSCDGTNWRIG